jgi:hypothetical protein
MRLNIHDLNLLIRELSRRGLARLTRSQPMPKRKQDHGGIAQPIAAALAGRFDQPVDLLRRQVLAPVHRCCDPSSEELLPKTMSSPAALAVLFSLFADRAMATVSKKVV